ncbi:MAG: rod shape-determining protein MreC [Chitinivibrionales bacterium]|nr:rod shape-determining protein MreC [Chitinivibrionales bacterium]MBD3396493.1 rod shape-determining protein MreC [Chitinivibrionales bacterium]
MQWIIQFIVHHRNLSSLFLTVMLSLWMLSGSDARQAKIARTLTMTVFFPFQFTVAQVARARNIFAENRRLREELTSLRTSASFLEEQAAENERLRDLLGFRESLDYTLLPARVVAREPSQLYRSLVLNVGKNQGVDLYMPVVSKDGIVGRVVQVMRHISLVQVLQDPSARTSVMTKRTRSVGILETENGRDFFIRHRTHVDVQQGDTIITSGLGGIYPKGLVVGAVTTVREGVDPLFKKTLLEPSVDFDHLEELFVMQISPQWTVLRGELDSVEMEK